MEGRNPYIDLSGVRDSSASPDYAPYRPDDAPSPREQPSQHSATKSPRNSTSNGQSGEVSGRPSYIKTRRASTSNPSVMATPTLRRRDSIKHPYSLTNASGADGDLNHSQADSAASSRENLQQKLNADSQLFRAAAHSRRHSAAVAVLHRDPSAGSPDGPVNTTVSASPDRPDVIAVPAATTQEDVKRYVSTVMSDHAVTLGTWEQRVVVAEVYRDKPRRTGGRPAPLRPQDRNFLERAIGGITAHLRQLTDARSLLQQTRRKMPPTRAGGRGDVNAWDEYCSCYEQTLMDLSAEAQQLWKRVNKLLKGDQQEGVRTHRTRSGSAVNNAGASRARSQGSVASRRSSPQATPRGPHTPPVEEPTAPATAAADPPSRISSASPSMGNLHSNNNNNGDAAHDRVSPYVPVLGSGGAVQRGSQAIRPGYGTESAMRASPAPESQRSWARMGSMPNPLRASMASATSAAVSTRSSQQARALHPDTVVRDSVPTGSPYDLKSPYGRLMSPKRASSPLRDPSHAVLVVPPPADVAAEMNEEAEAEAEAAAEVPQTARSRMSRASRASRASRSSRAASRAASSARPGIIDTPPQLRTYSSPRGSARAAAASSTANVAAATPSVHPLRRRQLLEVIEHYERNAATLQRGDLQRARECFFELYGEQQGLRQYCQWIDDIALSALQTPQRSA